jgi:hypothetical protein
VIGNFYVTIRTRGDGIIKNTAYLVITIELQIFLWLESIGIRVLRGSLDSLRNISQDLLYSEHSVGI